jgi:hypothetical protein
MMRSLFLDGMSWTVNSPFGIEKPHLIRWGFLGGRVQSPKRAAVVRFTYIAERDDCFVTILMRYSVLLFRMQPIAIAPRSKSRVFVGAGTTLIAAF